MTIRIEIKNDDNRDHALVVVKTQSRPTSAAVFMDVPGLEKRLRGQEKGVFWVYGNQRLIVEEVEVSHG